MQGRCAWGQHAWGHAVEGLAPQHAAISVAEGHQEAVRVGVLLRRGVPEQRGTPPHHVVQAKGAQQPEVPCARVD